MDARLGLGTAWHALAEALPPGWDIKALTQYHDNEWTAEVGPHTPHAHMRFQRVTGVRARGRANYRKSRFQAEGATPTEALLVLREQVMATLDRRLWEYNPEKAERPKDAVDAVLEALGVA
jgi:hypothetical protein